jgi:hypothetical protein
MFHRKPHVFRGLVAGMIGGAAGSWMMNHMDDLTRAGKSRQTAESARQEQAGTAVGSRPQHAKEQAQGGGEDATVKVAQTVSRNLFEHTLTDQEKKAAGPAVHYGYGTLVGGVYGALAEVWPNVKTGFGMGYGIAVWLLGSETALPALRLSPPPTDVPAHKHADNLAAHVCYGLTLDFVRRVAKVLV